MKKMKIFAAAAAAVALAACGGKPETKQYVGTIADATMNTVTVRSFDSETLFAKEGADLSEANGLLLGAPVVVEYTGDLAQPASVKTVKIATDATYAKAVGRWVEPNPINPDEMQGIEILVGGQAQSINMYTLRYNAWELTLDNDKILLLGESEGSGAPIEIEHEGVISKTDGQLTLTINGTTLVKVE